MQLLNDLNENRQAIALMKPVDNDQLFRLLGSDKSDNKKKWKPPIISAMKTYPDTFYLKIPSRMLVNTTEHRFQKCKDCEAVLTDDFNKLEGQPIVEQYEPEDKESLVSIYCEVLRQIKTLD